MKRHAWFLIAVVFTLTSSCNLGVAPGENVPTTTGPVAATSQDLDPHQTVPADKPTQAPATGTVAVPTTQPTLTPTATEFQPYTIREETRYEGARDYLCDKNGCWWTNGILTNPPEYYYPDINADNADIQALLADIGLPGTPAADDGEAWKRTVELWAWLSRNAQDSTKGGSKEANDYLLSLSYNLKPSQYPSIDDFGKVYARYHVLPWGSCTSRSLTFATFLYRTGIHPDKMAAAYFKTKDLSIQHFYVVIRSGAHWYYVDPICNDPGWSPALPFEPANVGCIPRIDYEHPFTLALLPGSILSRAMLVR